LQEQSAIQDPPRWGQGQENQAIRASLEKEHRKGGPVSVCLFLLRIGFSLKIWANKKPRLFRRGFHLLYCLLEPALGRHLGFNRVDLDSSVKLAMTCSAAIIFAAVEFLDVELIALLKANDCRCDLCTSNHGSPQLQG
jgi:hypothetical protein